MKEKKLCLLFLLAAGLSSCEVIDNDPDKHVQEKEDSTYIQLSSVAEILSEIPLGRIHLQEVHSAVSSSSGNGYDEEYTMRNLFTDPGSGVGDDKTRVRTKTFTNPLRDLIKDHVYSMASTKADDGIDPQAYLDMLTDSDLLASVRRMGRQRNACHYLRSGGRV